MGAAFDQPADPIACSVHGGELPSLAAGLWTDVAEVVVSSVKPADDGNGLVVRLVNHSDKNLPASIVMGEAMPFSPASIQMSDLLERPIASEARIPAHGIATLRLTRS